MGSAGTTNLGVSVDPAAAQKGIADLETTFANAMARMNALLDTFQRNLDRTADPKSRAVSINADTGRTTTTNKISGVEDGVPYRGSVTSTYDPNAAAQRQGRQLEMFEETKNQSALRASSQAEVIAAGENSSALRAAKQQELLSSTENDSALRSAKQAEVISTAENASALRSAKQAEVIAVSENASALRSAKQQELLSSTENDSALRAAKQQEVISTAENASALRSAKQAEVIAVSENAGALRSAKQQELLSSTENDSALRAAKQAEVISTAENASALRSAKQAEVIATSENAGALRAAKQQELLSTTENSSALRAAKQAEVISSAENASAVRASKQAEVIAVQENAGALRAAKQEELRAQTESAAALQAARQQEMMANANAATQKRAVAQQMMTADVDRQQSRLLASSEERLKMSSMNRPQQLSYLKGVSDDLQKTAKGTIEANDAQTRYNQALREGENRMGGMSNMFKHMILGFVAFKALEFVTSTITGVIDAQKEYSLATAQFAAITNQSIGAATQQWDALAGAVAGVGIKPSEAGMTIRLAAQFGGETEKGQVDFADTAAKLAATFPGADVNKISEGMGSVMKQTGEKDAGRIGDIITSTMQTVPGAEINDVMAALAEAPAQAKMWGVSWEAAYAVNIEGSQLAQEGAEQTLTALGRLTSGILAMSKGGANATEQMKKLSDSYGIDVVDKATGKYKEVPTVMGEVSRKLKTLKTPTEKEDLIETVAGTSIKQDQQRTIFAAIPAFEKSADTLAHSFDKVAGLLENAFGKIDETFGQLSKILDSNLEMLRNKGGMQQNFVGNILQGTIGKLGPVGAGAANYAVEQSLKEAEMTGPIEGIKVYKEKVMKELEGLSPEEAEKKINEYNTVLAFALMNSTNLGGLNFNLNPIEGSKNLSEKATAGAITANDFTIEGGKVKPKFAETGKEAGVAFLGGFKSAVSGIEDLLTGLLGKKGVAAFGALGDVLFGKKAEEATPPSAAPARTLTPEQRFGETMMTTMFSPQTGKMTDEALTAIPSFMETSPDKLDLTKYTQDEINAAKALSIQLTQQEVDLQTALLISWGATPEQVKLYIDALKKAIDETAILVKTSSGVSMEFGPQARSLGQALKQNDETAKEEKSNFQFKRYKDFDPAQFGQLQALTAMYDKMLTGMGSPEKSQKINLLLGENNTFKTMNARMTALQMAMEDLTKVEKAQLSGTWNMPAGATALVPISSLDIQRWNKSSSGGGMSEEALRALLGATNQSGDTVSTSMQTAATRIIAAIRENMLKSGLPTDKLDQAKTPSEAIKSIGDTMREKVNAALAVRDSAQRVLTSKTEENFTPDKSLKTKPAPTWQELFGIRPIPMSRMNEGDGLMSKDPGATSNSKPMTTTVNVSMLPVKATMNTNISVLMNGAVVARALMPIMWDMLIRQASSAGIKPSNPGR